MDRYTVIVVALCIAVMLGYLYLANVVFPPPERPIEDGAESSSLTVPTPEERVERAASQAELVAAPDTSEIDSDTAKERPAGDVPAEVVLAPAEKEPTVERPVTEVQAPAPVPTVAIQDDITLETDLFRAVFSNRGASLVSLTLRDFYSTAEKKEEAEIAGENGDQLSGDLELLRHIAKGESSLVMMEPPDRQTKSPIREFDKQIYKYEGKSVSPDGVEKVVFSSTFDKLEVTKTFSLTPGSRTIGVNIALQNNGAQPMDLEYMLRSAAGIPPEQIPCSAPGTPVSGKGMPGMTRSVIAKQFVEDKLELISDTPIRGGGGCACIGRSGPKVFTRYEQWPVAWVGVDATYFAALLAPAEGTVDGALPGAITDTNITCSLITKEHLPPGETIAKDYLFFVGPKTKEALAQVDGKDLGFLIEPTGFSPIRRISSALGWFLRVFSKIAPNYGVAIVMLTVLVRVVLHPLTSSSQKSMYRMQKLQPKVSEIRERLKNDKQRQHQEIMQLYKEHGVNPLGGCLPMLLQFPILIGLFRLLQKAIELRQEPFMLWMKDLSKPDALICLPFQLPLIGSNALNLLPILMIIAMIAQQKLTPKSGDPQQQQTQKMMAFMPVFFGFLFYNMASGLVLYWLTSTTLGALEQWYIRKRMQEADEAGPMSRAKKSNIKLRRFKS